MIDIQPLHLTFANLLNGRLFNIPDYQRAYSWTSRERKDLFEDINNLQGENASHFMAVIVCLRKKKITLGTHEFHKLDIVDGQQRLTTLIILLNAIRLALNCEDAGEELTARELKELLVKVGGDNLLLLQTNHDTSHHFADFIRYGKSEDPEKGKTLADRELLAAIADCKKFVKDWVENGHELTLLVGHIKNRLSFILHEISDEKTVYTVFEVLNSRGMEVSWLDRLKSILMGAAYTLEDADSEQLIKDLRIIWSDIYSTVGLTQGLSTEALRFAATLRASTPQNRPMSEQAAVDEFRSAAHDAREIRDVARWLLQVTKACDAVVSKHRLNAVTRISQARLLAVAIHLCERVTKKDQARLLSIWEKVSFRIYGMLRHDARTRVGEYARLARKIVRENLTVDEIFNEIRSIGNDFPIEDAVKALRNANCYEGWQEELRYFMFRYEEYLTKQKGNKFKNEQWEKIWSVSPSKSIEHIYPQNTAPDHVKHRLGNLLLLPPSLNSRLGGMPSKKKFEKYRETGLLIAVEVASNKRWSIKAIRLRERKILEWASREWDSTEE
ncbi:MAG: DUF262 domain-containing protein [Candidatus Dadabacteria bacterium]|nr:DUF262 domain-containing protein [Candidatus Dadabacteria bacterium]MYC40131.1 DUF262 domain-containing protein [Candidatus Dadabacteria bacterium]